MKKLIFNTAVAGLVIALGIGASLGQERDSDREQLNKKVEAVNEAARKPGMMEVALKRISTQTGVPLEQVQTYIKSTPKFAPGDCWSRAYWPPRPRNHPRNF